MSESVQLEVGKYYHTKQGVRFKCTRIYNIGIGPVYELTEPASGLKYSYKEDGTYNGPAALGTGWDIGYAEISIDECDSREDFDKCSDKITTHSELQSEIDKIASRIEKPPFHNIFEITDSGYLDIKQTTMLMPDEALRLAKWIINFYGDEYDHK